MDETLTNFDAFFTKLMSNYDAMQKTAEDKLAQEQLAIGAHIDIPSWFPGSDDDKQGDNTACGFGEARQLLSSFGGEHLNGDYNALQNMKSSLDAARAALNGGEGPAPESGDTLDSDVVELAGGLGSWKTPTADLFRDKYVDPIGSCKTRQYEAIGESKKAVETAIDILVETRKVALQLPLDAKKGLDEYNPVKSAMKGNAKVVFRVLGKFYKPAKLGAAVITISDLGKSGLSVATLMDAFRLAVITCRDNKFEGEKGLAGLLDQYATNRSNDWAQHVCARPAP